MLKTQMERLWALAALVVALLMVLVGYLMFISPQNSDTSNAQAQVSSARTVNMRLQSRIDSLRAQSKNLTTYESELQAAQLALPDTSGLPDFLRTLQSIGNATHANVSSLAVGLPTDVTGVAGIAARTAGAAAPAVIGGVRVYALPITAQVGGTTAQLDEFLTQLQSVQPRAVLISQLTEGNGQAGGGAAGAAGGNTMQLTMEAFVAPSSAAERSQLSAAAGK